MNVVLEPWVIIREKKVYRSLNKEANIRSLVTTIRRGDSSKSEYEIQAKTGDLSPQEASSSRT